MNADDRTAQSLWYVMMHLGNFGLIERRVGCLRVSIISGAAVGLWVSQVNQLARVHDSEWPSDVVESAFLMGVEYMDSHARLLE